MKNYRVIAFDKTNPKKCEFGCPEDKDKDLTEIFAEPNLKRIRGALKEYFFNVDHTQIKFGEYVHTIGYKYVTIINCHGKTTLEKIPLDVFKNLSTKVEDGDYTYSLSFNEILNDYHTNCNH